MRRLAVHTPVALICALFIYAGQRGIDYGHHWDEVDWQIRPVQAMVSSGVLVPRAYIYPSFARWLVLLPALGAGGRAGLDGQPVRQVQAAIVAAFDAPGFLLTVRTLFLCVTALSIVWVYLAALALDRSWWRALIAAAAFGLTFELSYHARFVATDSICTQFAALTLLGLALHHRTKATAWLYAAAIAAGFCTGTKYPGVIVLATVVIAGALALPLKAVKQQAWRAATLCATAFGAYLVTTPGTLINPFDFYEQLKGIDQYYATGHYGYTVLKGIAHLKVALLYLAFDLFSPYQALALASFAAALVGGWLRIREDRRLGLTLASFPVLFLWFFCWKYNVFIARNYLLIAPFLAVLLSRAVAEPLLRARTLRTRQVLALPLVAAAVLHAVWLYAAGESIRARNPADEARAALEFVAEHPAHAYRVSPRVLQLAQQGQVPLPANAGGQAPQSVVFFARADGPDPTRWTVNDPWLTEATFGPKEINFDYYSTWEGQDRIVVMSVDKARAAGVALAN